eukprot:TRINITY_DN43682_c0_g1_i1.p1 TRINITY_DN43682_c0_g1~~TRINITY_DN43682_c0_g1_i1.p1  ORF type:complete len:574 (+),score=57.56 TRINITY_DN43682_c0_g1_i1:75-1796(+)
MATVGANGVGDVLPRHLRERIRVGKNGRTSNGPVLYWMRSCLRAHENPALDVAASKAKQLDVPLVVLLHVEDRYPHATARRQMFLLEGAQATQAELTRRGVHAIVQIDREGYRPELHLSMASEASLVLAEEPFCVPWLAGVESLCRHAFEAPLWVVDCCSVVPSALVDPRHCHRAYSFAQATRQLHEERVAHTWTDVPIEGLSDALPKDVLKLSLDLQSADLSSLLKEMEVDMSVPPVHHTLGGSFAGYSRWNEWVSAGGLSTYAKRRNDSLDIRGVSRMSGYLNTGMVSPMRIAREAAAANGAGKGKYLDELLTWRGISYAFCYHFPMPAAGVTLAQLPRWAQESLEQHAAERVRPISCHQLSCGQSGNKAWDGMQQYLVQTGELHNNARMGWGKAIAKWAASPQDALRSLVEINNRFALDGHAPPSYGGLLGSLGLFEGPKSKSPVLGCIAFKPPKEKYAAMPRCIDAIPNSTAGIEQGTSRSGVTDTSVTNDSLAGSRCTDAMHGRKMVFAEPPTAAKHDISYYFRPSKEVDLSQIVKRPGCTADGNQVQQETRKRRWVKKDSDVHIDLT